MAALHDAVTVSAPALGTLSGGVYLRTVSHTNGAGVPTNGTLLVWAWVDSATDVVTAVTYNGVAQAQTTKSATGPNTQWKYLWRFPSPASGAHDLVITTPTQINVAVALWSFTVAAQGDLSVVQGGVSSSSTNFVVSVDTIIDDCVVGMFAANSVGVPTGVGATNTPRSLTVGRASITQRTAVVATPAQVYPSFTIDVAAQWDAWAFALGPYVAPGGGAGPAAVHARKRRG